VQKSGFPVSFELVETRNPLFYTRERFPRPGECPARFFYVQNAPLLAGAPPLPYCIMIYRAQKKKLRYS
jgi:hypothetical protein